MALSEEKKEQLKADFEAGKIPVTEIAKKHGVSRSTIIRLSEKWKRAKRKKQKLKPKPTKPKKGRPEKYKPEYAKFATALCMLGYTDEMLANTFSVLDRTIYNWKKKHPEFFQALRDGREKASAKVAVSLFQRATGYSHDDEKIFQHEGEIIRAKTKKYYPPDVKAIIIWLKNKFPELWRDKQEIEGVFEQRIGKIIEEDAKIIKDLFDDITED